MTSLHTSLDIEYEELTHKVPDMIHCASVKIKSGAKQLFEKLCNIMKVNLVLLPHPKQLLKC